MSTIAIISSVAVVALSQPVARHKKTKTTQVWEHPTGILTGYHDVWRFTSSGAGEMCRAVRGEPRAAAGHGLRHHGLHGHHQAVSMEGES